MRCLTASNTTDSSWVEITRIHNELLIYFRSVAEKENQTDVCSIINIFFNTYITTEEKYKLLSG